MGRVLWVAIVAGFFGGALAGFVGMRPALTASCHATCADGASVLDVDGVCWCVWAADRVRPGGAH